MFLVVLGHCSVWTANDWRFHFCYGVHMPLFMFVSGGLFYYTRISRGWRWGDVVVDKLKRLGVPYLFFIAFAFGLKVALSGLVKNPVDASLSGFLAGFVFPIQSGMKEMWFVAALLLLMFCYPLYGLLLRSRVAVAMALALGVVFTFVFPGYTGGGVFNWQGALRYFVFFFGGMAFFKYNMLRFVKNVSGGDNFICLIFSHLCVQARAAVLGGLGGHIGLRELERVDCGAIAKAFCLVPRLFVPDIPAWHLPADVCRFDTYPAVYRTLAASRPAGA